MVIRRSRFLSLECTSKSLFYVALLIATASVFSASKVSWAQATGPGAIMETTVALEEAPGATFPWEGNAASGAGSLNTGNGNKLTTIPLVGWTGRGGLPVSLKLYHNSQAEGVSELGERWTHSYDIYLVHNPTTNDVTVQWGDSLSYVFAYHSGSSGGGGTPPGGGGMIPLSSGGSGGGGSSPYFQPPAGIYDDLTFTTDTNGGFTTFWLTTKSGLRYTFSNPVGNRWRCAAIADRNGNQINLTHDIQGYVTGITDPSNRALTFAYATVNGAKRLSSVTDPAGRVFSFTYHTAGNGAGSLASVVYPAPDGPASGGNPVISLAYNGDHRITGITDPRGNTTTFGYNSNGSLSWEKNPLNQQVSYAYTASYTDITDARGFTARHTYSGGRLVSVRDAQNFTESYGYDSSITGSVAPTARGKPGTTRMTAGGTC
ncbi:MAG: hypothetical protein OHK0029_36650 [Armatimonadaceae bacterium]